MSQKNRQRTIFRSRYFVLEKTRRMGEIRNTGKFCPFPKLVESSSSCASDSYDS